jgi:RimJ/RimL family protein N-acetyltransferase
MARLHTDRLVLRPFRRGDAQAFAQLAGEWGVASMTSDIPYPLTAEQAQLWLKPARGEVRFAVEHAGRLVGGAGFYRRASGSAELGFWFGAPWWGKGFATEATRAVIAHGFLRHKVPMFTSAHFLDNPASCNVLAKLGFQAAGDCRIICVSRGEEVPARTYWLDRPNAARVMPGLDRKPATLDKLKDLVGWFRRAPDRKISTSSTPR